MITLLAPGPLKYPFVKEGLDYFSKLLSKWVKINCLFPKISLTHCNKEERLKAEERVLLNFIKDKSYLIVLDERGQALNIYELAELLKEFQIASREVTFLVGGPEGLSPNIKRRGNFLLKISELTLNHEIVLLVLIESLFRAFSIIKGHPYHRA